MLVGIKQGFVFLSMPKCASTSIVKALQPYMDLVARGPLKHSNCRRYQRFIRPFLAQCCEVDSLETVCVIRDPIAWLESWYRYRTRLNVAHMNSTAKISFDEFVEGYLRTERPAWAELGSQYDFIRNEDGDIGVNRIFPYERFDLLVEYLNGKMRMELNIGIHNQSPKMEITLNPDLRERLLEYYEKDFAVYAKALAGCGG